MLSRDVQNGTAVARLLGEPPQMRTGLVTLGAPGEHGCFAVVYEASGGAEEDRSAPPRLVDTTASFSSTGPPNPNPTRARRTPRHTRRD